MDPESSLGIQLIIIIGCLVLTAILAAAERALVSVNQKEIQKLADQGQKQAMIVRDLLAKSDQFLASLQVVTHALSLLSSLLIGKLCLARLSLPFVGADLLALAALSLLITCGQLLLVDRLPKQWAQQAPEEAALATSRWALGAYYLSYPLVKFLVGTARILQRILSVDFDQEEATFTRAEMQAWIDQQRDIVVDVDTQEIDMLHGVLSLDQRSAQELMVPRIDTEMIDLEDPYEENLALIVNSRFSRIPLYRETKDNVVGVLLVQHLLKELYVKGKEEVDLMSLALEPIFMPSTVYTDDLLRAFKESHQHLAILLDEYGGVEGIITLEDLLEEIVGEISDETDGMDPDEIEDLDEGEYLVNGLLPVDKFNAFFQTDIESDDVKTIAGYFLHVLGQMPADDELASIDLGPWTLETYEVEGGRIRHLVVRAKEVPVLDEVEDLAPAADEKAEENEAK